MCKVRIPHPTTQNKTRHVYKPKKMKGERGNRNKAVESDPWMVMTRIAALTLCVILPQKHSGLRFSVCWCFCEGCAACHDWGKRVPQSSLGKGGGRKGEVEVTATRTQKSTGYPPNRKNWTENTSIQSSIRSRVEGIWSSPLSPSPSLPFLRSAKQEKQASTCLSLQ
jgi:hypothetical protein